MAAVAFVDFKKAFDSVCHTLLETKLERDFGVSGPLLDWLKSYLKGRQQVTVIFFSFSDTSSVIWHTARVKSRAYAFYNVYERLTNVCSVRSVYMFADDTTIHCIGTSAVEANAQLNLAMQRLTRVKLSKAMLNSRKYPMHGAYFSHPYRMTYYQMDTLTGDDS